MKVELLYKLIIIITISLSCGLLPLMDLKKDLQILIERTWSFHDDISDRIHDHDQKLRTCRFCLDPGRHCGIPDTPLKDNHRDSLISIRDSLNHFQDMLMSLQRQSLSHQSDRLASVTRIDESRKMLMEEVEKFKGRKGLSVVEELNCYFGEESIWIKNLKGSDDDDGMMVVKKRNPSMFVMRCIRSLISQFQWRINRSRTALKFMVVSACISSLLGFIQSKRSCWQTAGSRRSIHVFHGKG